MGALGKLINISLFFFFALMAINVPLLNGQILFPGIYPKLLTDLKDWYSSEFNDYLFIEKPLFFVGLVWHEIIFLLPLSIVNIYAILTSKSWFGTTSLLYGASFLTSMAAILGDMIGSEKVTNKLLLAYLPFVGLAILAMLRGLVTCSTKKINCFSQEKACLRINQGNFSFENFTLSHGMNVQCENIIPSRNFVQVLTQQQ